MRYKRGLRKPRPWISQTPFCPPWIDPLDLNRFPGIPGITYNFSKGPSPSSSPKRYSVSIDNMPQRGQKYKLPGLDPSPEADWRDS